jgi:hypothetical protein
MPQRTEIWYAEMDAITCDLTGYESFEQLCLNRPTLRVVPGMSPECRAKMLRLRAAYFQETGQHTDGGEIDHLYRYTVVTQDGKAYFGKRIGETLFVENGRWIDHQRRRIGFRDHHVIIWTDYPTSETFIEGLKEVDAWLHSVDRKKSEACRPPSVGEPAAFKVR